ncbi:MAG TPA: hypothetical protein VJI98_04140 [Candidatus Nanoarchaeia archaeon]|nr:hypothetical protein [Candidatus Nanoarchaeia archaeon]
MESRYDFNTSRIIQGYLDQALPEFELEVYLGQAHPSGELENLTERFVAGVEGGLAYKLFTKKDRTRLIRNRERIRIDSINALNILAAFSGEFKQYINTASNYANEAGFGLVVVDGFGRICPTTGADLFDYGMGAPKIESVERFNKFLKLVKKAKPQLDVEHAGLMITLNSIFLP